MRNSSNKSTVLITSIFISIIYTASFGAKLNSFEIFCNSIYISRILPMNLSKLFGLFIIISEFTIAISLLIPKYRPFSSKISLLMSCLFLSFNIWRMIVNIPTPCNCLGDLIALSHTQSIILNIVMICISAYIVFSTNGGDK
jgi:hypothetical protein